MERKTAISVAIINRLLKELCSQEQNNGRVTGVFIYVDKQINIYLPCFYGTEKIKFMPLSRTLFYFFLLRPQGLFRSDLKTYKNELTDIYNLCRRRFNESNNSTKVIDNMVDISSGGFHETCSRIKNSLIRMLGKENARYYYIMKDTDGRYKIKAALCRIEGKIIDETR